jgi:hypothetical protein
MPDDDIVGTTGVGFFNKFLWNLILWFGEGAGDGFGLFFEVGRFLSVL